MYYINIIYHSELTCKAELKKEVSDRLACWLPDKFFLFVGKERIKANYYSRGYDVWILEGDLSIRDTG
ncbi:hypothetical protein SY88_04535 [Clostridiales bacterium PH28_bin88]|nr:hypothetical protein SY88_04535 [Clostridiales bacterium PH28_bin88]